MTTLGSRLATKERQLAKANTTYEALLENEEQQYTGDFGAGRMSVQNRSLKDLEMAIKRLEIEVDRLRNRLKGRGIVKVNLRRHG